MSGGAQVPFNLMGEKYKLQSLGSDNEVRSVAFTNEPEITIGSGLDADVRLQQPSIEENHVLVYFDHMKVRVFGGNVFLNEEPLERESMYAFRFGDVLRINRYRFVFSLTEPGDFVDEDKVIRRPTMELSYLAEGHEKGGAAGEAAGKKESVGGDEGGSGGADAVVSIALNKVAGVHVSLVGGAGDVCVKQAIEEQKEVLRQEIEESIGHGVVDIPVLPSMGKKSVRDLGEVMIEKEILDSAEKVVSERMRGSETGVEESLDELKQSVKDNIKEELREDLRRDFMGDVREDIRDEVKEVLCSSEMKSAIATDVMSRIEDAREPVEREGSEEQEDKPESQDGGEEKERPVRPKRRASSAGARAKEGAEESREAPSRKASIRGRKQMAESASETPKKRRGAKQAAGDGGPDESPKRKKGQKKQE